MPTPAGAKIYTILFLLKGQDISRLGVTEIPGCELIINLRNLIQSESMTLVGVDRTELSLYIAPMPSGNNNALRRFYLQLDRNEHQKLGLMVRIEDAFPEPGTLNSIVIVETLDVVNPISPAVYQAVAQAHARESSRGYLGELPAQELGTSVKREITIDHSKERWPKRLATFKMDGDPILKLSRRIMRSPGRPEDYCDPQKLLKVPFPFPEERPDDRFKFDKKGRFSYYGCQKFQKLYRIATKMRFPRRRLHFVRGSLGAGKSHMLAALACALIKSGRRVVYIPDCRDLLKAPFRYLRSALQLTFARDEDCREYLDCARTLADLDDFCQDAAPKFRLLFIVDQANALDHQVCEMNGQNSSEKKREVRDLLDSISTGHLKLAC